ncbi:helix-turn-helix domain-containing protein [Virgibacillus alimentarius]|uniref:helix-turn-helix domain-containing protein n=1 Tax=Virgibacillus alimentarius TaxID=698769 RepID=UPI000492FBD1|nr:helix-turn-helix domain-containing protein [Virgibacillus alimentarius]
MNTIKYCTLFLQRKLKSVQFQIWGYHDVTNEVYLIKDSKGKGYNTNPPIFTPTSNMSLEPYKITKQIDETLIQFNYTEGNRLAIRIFNKTIPFNKDEIENLYHLLKSIELEEIIKNKNNELKTLMKSMQSITSSLNLNDVLKSIIRHALNVIPAADVGYLMLYDHKQERLITKASVGFNDEIYNFQTKVYEAITGSVFADGQVRIFNSYDELNKAMYTYNISSENLETLLKAAPHPEGAICTPISIGEKRIGVMIIHQWKIKKKLMENDSSLLQSFADQAGLAIQNATYYTETKTRLKEITALSKQFREKNTQLMIRQEVHETLTMLLLKNKGIASLVNSLKTMMGQELTLFNCLENTFYSPKANEYYYFSVFEIKTIFSKKRQAVFVQPSDDNEKLFYLYPIYNGTVFFGCLMLRLSKPLSNTNQITLEQGSTVLALEFVKRQTSTKIYHRELYEQFKQLLSFKEPQQIRHRGREMGLPISAYWMIAILEIPNPLIRMHYLDIEIQHITAKINKELNSSENLICGFYNKIILLHPLFNQNDVKTVHRKLNTIKNDGKHFESPIFRGGLSTAYHGLENINKCYDEANNALTYVSKRNSTEITCYGDIGLDRLFLHHSSQEIDQFIDDTFSRFSPNNTHDKELEKTLMTYVDLNHSASRTAKALHIHINTFYQRLNKIEDLLELDLNNSEDVLKIQLACYLKKSQMIENNNKSSSR